MHVHVVEIMFYPDPEIHVMIGHCVQTNIVLMYIANDWSILKVIFA